MNINSMIMLMMMHFNKHHFGLIGLIWFNGKIKNEQKKKKILILVAI